jgi:hypothetical protein
MPDVESLKNCEKCEIALLEGEKTSARCKKDQEQGEHKNKKSTGNSAGNFLNDGHAVLHGDWIYIRRCNYGT